MKKLNGLTSKQPLPRVGDTTWCLTCISVALLGNVCNIALGTPDLVTVAYAIVSGLFALLAGVAVALWETLRRLTD
jgi:hypothetical protein